MKIIWTYEPVTLRPDGGEQTGDIRPPDRDAELTFVDHDRGDPEAMLAWTVPDKWGTTKAELAAANGRTPHSFAPTGGRRG